MPQKRNTLQKSSLQSTSRELEDMQKNYETPEVEIIELEDRDVIVASFIDGAGDSGTGDF